MAHGALAHCRAASRRAGARPTAPGTHPAPDRLTATSTRSRTPATPPRPEAA
ncbi:hypothetical protein [Streptomyces sp. NPDC021203]|uniref:hypothetical protein n=1 Tax=Streptomyces sp. NPDC021203 TaxID=3365117 RepID=UPI00378C80B1